MLKVDLAPIISCANCRQPMQFRDLERTDHGVVRVDLCFTCAGIWFDSGESIQLAPAAVIELFKEIHAHRDLPRQALGDHLGCPRCGDALALGFDLCKTGRFTYFRCLRGDGRFTPFMQFLREKQFICDLTVVEIQRVRSKVRQIRCSECGAPIDLEHYSQCEYCHSPVSFLDPEAVEKAMHMWSDAEGRRHLAPNMEAAATALMRLQLPHATPTPLGNLGSQGLLSGQNLQSGADLALDLVSIGIQAVGRLFEH